MNPAFEGVRILETMEFEHTIQLLEGYTLIIKILSILKEVE